MHHKKKLIVFGVLLIFFRTYTDSSYVRLYFNQGQTFKEWATKCDRLPFLRSFPSNAFQTPLTGQEFADTLQVFIAQQAVCLKKENLWIDNAPTHEDPIFRRTSSALVNPFVQRLLLPDNARVAFHGDLHGDAHSLIAYLKELENQALIKNFVLQDKNFYMIFLGDYTDRGLYGSEVIYTLLRLKIANPQHVFLVRGNHEDLAINASFGFEEELRAKFNNTHELLSCLNTFYNLLPVAIYVGYNHNYLQCCHGGLEIGFDTHALLDAPEQPVYFQWLGNLMQKTNYLKTSCSCFDGIKSYFYDKRPTYCSEIGFMWNDFIVNEEKQSCYNPGRGFKYSKKATLAILNLQSSDTNKICGVIRAHQHVPALNSMMRSLLRVDATGKLIEAEQNRCGVSTLWDIHNQTSSLWEGIVCTLLVSPDTPYGQANGAYPGFNYDTYATLTVAEKFEDWDLRVTQVPVIF